jgi:cell wall assembly regulator SMI1
MKNTILKLISIAKEKNPNLIIELNEGAKKSDIDNLGKIINKELPSDFVKFYSHCNGFSINSTRLFNGLRILTIDEIIFQWQSMNEIKNSGAFVKDGKEILADTDKKIKNNWWNENWLPITDNLSGDYTILDLDPNKNGIYGQLFEFWHDPSYRNVVASSLKKFIEQTTIDIKNNKLKYSADYNGFVNFI